MTRVRMVGERVIQDAGVERPLVANGLYTLPSVLAQSLVAAGAAVLAEERPAVLAAPERAVFVVPETKRGRRGRSETE